MTAARLALALALRGWRALFATTLMLTAGTVVFALSLSDVMTQVAVLEGGRTLRSEGAVSFATYYQPRVLLESPEAVEVAAGMIASGEAYSAVLYNTDVDGRNAQPEPLVYVLGDAVRSLFPDLEMCTPAPCALVGRDLDATALEHVDVGGLAVPVVGRLARDATWFDPKSVGLPLGERVVVNLPAEHAGRLDAYAQEELLSRMVLLDPSDAEVDRLVDPVARAGVHLVPSRLAEDQPRAFASTMTRSALHLAAVAAYLALGLTVLAASLRRVLERETSRLRIHRLSGASGRQLLGAVALFYACGSVLLPLLACAPFLLLGGDFARAVQLTALCALVAYAVLLGGGLRTVDGQTLGRA